LNPIRGSSRRLIKVCNEFLAKNFLGDRIKKAEMGGACVAPWWEGKCVEGLGRKTKNLAVWIT
jgi:hypothetical protein